MDILETLINYVHWVELSNAARKPPLHLPLKVRIYYRQYIIVASLFWETQNINTANSGHAINNIPRFKQKETKRRRKRQVKRVYCDDVHLKSRTGEAEAGVNLGNIKMTTMKRAKEKSLHSWFQRSVQPASVSPTIIKLSSDSENRSCWMT